jgi:replicative DNA helicase
MEAVSSASYAVYYAKIVREKGIMRQLLKAVFEIQESIKSERHDLDFLLDQAERLIFEITQKGTISEPAHIKILLRKVLIDIEKNLGKNNIEGIPTGFVALDSMTAGFSNSSLIIIAGRPSMGKTSFALNIAAHLALHNEIGTLIFTLEMSKEQVAQNLLCSQAQISPHQIRTGTLEEEKYSDITTTLSWLNETPIFIDDTPGISLREIKAKTRRLKMKQQISFVIIDYIQLIEVELGKSENRQQEISYISRSLKSLARELNIPVVALSQLNRSVDSRDDHRPRMSDLRESGALEQDADLILFLYREEYYDKNTSNKGIAEVIVAKNRNGPTGDVQLRFIKEHMRFHNLGNTK